MLDFFTSPDFNWGRFLLDQIPFVLFLLVLVYFFWVRPNRKYKRLTEDPDRFFRMGDEILMDDGVLGLFVKYRDGKITIESGSTHTKLVYPRENISANLDAEQRVAESYRKKSFWQKVAWKL